MYLRLCVKVVSFWSMFVTTFGLLLSWPSQTGRVRKTKTLQRVYFAIHKVINPPLLIYNDARYHGSFLFSRCVLMLRLDCHVDSKYGVSTTLELCRQHIIFVDSKYICKHPHGY